MKATSIKQTYLNQTIYKNGEDIYQTEFYIAVAASGDENLRDNLLGGGNDLIILQLAL